VTADGAITVSGPVPTDFVEGGFEMLYGPGDRVLIATNAQNWAHSGEAVRYVIADATGTIVDNGRELFEADIHSLGATTDGVAFFVGSHGNLARIAPDGTVATFAGFPLSSEQRPAVRLAWSTSGGWYVVKTGASEYTVQRFDATGAPVGSPYALSLVYSIRDIEADGADLLLLGLVRAAPPAATRLALVRVASDGTVVAADDIGAGDGTPLARIHRRSADLLVNWQTRWGTYLASVTP
jgi:hypothetical protein